MAVSKEQLRSAMVKYSFILPPEIMAMTDGLDGLDVVGKIVKL